MRRRRGRKSLRALGAIFALPEWLEQALVGAAVVLTVGLLVGWLGKRDTDSQIAELLAKRANPSRDEFLALMVPDVSQEASEFLWEVSVDAIGFFRPELTIHPDDNLLDDLPIDQGEWDLDWASEWANGLIGKEFLRRFCPLGPKTAP